MALNPRHRDAGAVSLLVLDAAGLAATLVILVIGGYVLVGAGVRKSGALTQERESLTAQLERLTELADTLGEGEETLSALESGMGELEMRLPAKLDFAPFYSDLMRLAAKNRVTLAEMLPGEIRLEERYVSLPISLSARASFESFHQFLYALTTLPRLTKLESFTINLLPDEDRCEINISLNIYAAKADAGEPSDG